MPFGRKSPLEALALPGVILAYKYSQFRQRRREAASRRVTERELSALHHKIDKLLSKLEESEPEPPTSQEDECVICINARATMQTSPCGHKVVCRRCFVKTIQSAVAQRLLPLRCVICRARVNRLTSGSGTWRLQESSSSYSVGAKSWSPSVGTNSVAACRNTGVPQSASSYSMGNEPHTSHNRQNHNSGHIRVSQSASSYSVGSSLSSSSNATTCSNMSSASSNVDSSSSATNLYHNHSSHHHGSTCPTGCSGAIPRKPSLIGHNGVINTFPRRYTKGRIADLQQNRLPPIKEFRSPAKKLPHPSPVHISNPRFRYSSYTKTTNSQEMVPLLKDPSPPRPIKNTTTKTTSLSTPASGSATSKLKPSLAASKIHPTASKIPIQKNSLTAPKSTSNNNNNVKSSLNKSNKAELNHPSSSKSFSFINSNNNNNKSKTNNNISNCNSNNNNNSLRNNFHNHQDEKADNKKNESMEKKKKEEKLKLKAEKEARKEEKRLAKEEERLAKIIAKEEKKKGKREARELLLANDGNNKK